MPRLIQRFVEWATPSKFNAEENTHLTFRALILIFVNISSILVTIAASAVYFFSRIAPSMYDYLLPSGIVVCCLSLLVLKLKGCVRAGASIFIGLLYLVIVSLVLVEGIIFSSSMYWLAFFPVFAVFMMGRIPGIILGVVSVVTVIGINFLFYNNGLALRNHWTFDQFSQSILFDSVGMIVMGLCLSLIYEGSRERTDAELQRYQAKIFKQARLTELGEMAGGVAHEINNPLAVIVSFSEMTLENLRTGVDVSKEELTLAFERMLFHSQRIEKIVRSLKLYARDGSQDPMEQVEIGAILEDALILCRERAASQGTELEISSHGARLGIGCRRSQIAQILINLLNNALDAVEGSPVGKISVRVSSENNFCEIIVADNGPGVPQALVEKIMNPFFTTKPIGKGTGLGLSISSGIAKVHGGQLVLLPSESGAVFSLKIPIALL